MCVPKQQSGNKGKGTADTLHGRVGAGSESFQSLPATTKPKGTKPQQSCLVKWEEKSNIGSGSGSQH